MGFEHARNGRDFVQYKKQPIADVVGGTSILSGDSAPEQ